MTSSTPASSGRLRQLGFTLAGVFTLILAWGVVAHGQHEYILPSPASALKATWAILYQADFWLALSMTAMRAASGLGIALVVGVIWGAAMGRWPAIDAFSQPAVQILLATPAVVFVVLALVWFGSSNQAVVMVVALVATPLIVKTTAGAVRNIDPSLDEMGQVFGLSRGERIRHILIPLIFPPYIAAATVAMGQSLRVAVMAELLATASGLGGAIRLAQLNIETPKVFAYALILTTVALALELVLVAPFKGRQSRYRAVNQA